MADSTVLLEEKKETTTFYLEEGDTTEQKGIVRGRETTVDVYDPLKRVSAEDLLSIDPSSDIAMPTAKKYENGDIILGIAINDPVSNTTVGKRETGVLILGQLFRFKVAENESGIDTLDRIGLTGGGAVANNTGDYVALHPIEDQKDYEYIDVLRPFGFP